MTAGTNAANQMTNTFAALATARLPAEIYLLAIGNLIVHLLTVSFPYVSPNAIQEQHISTKSEGMSQVVSLYLMFPKIS